MNAFFASYIVKTNQPIPIQKRAIYKAMKINLTKKAKKRIILLISIILFGVFAYWQNNDITVSEYEYTSSKVAKEFDGFRIVQLSDYHNKYCGENQKNILNIVSELSPDIIVITGDIIDQNFKGYENSQELVIGAVEIAPVYYVTGNHERSSDEYEIIRKTMLDAGVNVLEDEIAEIKKGDAAIQIVGLDYDSLQSNVLESLMAQTDENSISVLLSHNPEEIDYYSECGADMVFCGHAHGGQIRLPFTQGLYAPDQGILPKYTAGVHESGNLTEYISRGIGNSGFPLRIFNRPEIVCVTLRAE